MKLFIFGAGASVASQTNRPHVDASTAPLVDQLFDPPYDGYASELGIQFTDFQSLQPAVGSGESVEEVLTRKWRETETIDDAGFREAHRKLFGDVTFYIWWLLQHVSATYDGNNGYRRFAERLRERRERFAMISYNYDTLLDRAMQDIFNMTCAGELSTYTKHPFPLVKPHGSVNWFLTRRNSDTHASANEEHRDSMVRYGLARGQMFKDEPLAMNSLQVVAPEHVDLTKKELITSVRFGLDYFYPLVLAPLTTKLYTHVQGFREEIIDAGRNLVSEAEEIYLIGYRAVDEAMSEMFESLREGVKLHVIGNGGAGQIAQRLLREQPHVRVGTVYEDGFWAFINDYGVTV